MKKDLLCFAIAVIFWLPVQLNAQMVKYSRVKIFTNEKGLSQLSAAGVAVDHGERKKGVYFISDFSESEIATIQSKGFKTEVLIDDVSAYYIKRNAEKLNSTPPAKLNSACAAPVNRPVPAGFKFGSMGGYHTFNEIIANLDTLHALYPNLISAKAQINATKSIEGRPVYWMRISNNPTVNQNKPQILYTALTHAREPASASQMLYYMYYLCENYNTDPEVKYLVDNTEMYFVPCLNPDGYVYNESTNPSGGGMWRKNRRNNNDGTMGVDLNRNYGFDWGYDNIGSSPTTSSDTYRGTAAFSEPEIAMMEDFDSKHHFRIGVNYHTYGNDLIYPWGYKLGFYTPDSSFFVEYARLMTSENHFAYGTGDQTVGYVTNGDSDDWSYGDQTTKPMILSMTPEVGSSSDGFWPPQNSILPICQNSLSQNLYAALCITKYAKASDESPYYLTQKNGFLNYKIKRIGLDSPATYTVTLIPISSSISSVGSPKSYSSLGPLQEKHDSISFSLNSSVTQGTLIKYVIAVSNGTYTQYDTITKMYGNPTIAFASSASSMAGWASADWGLTSAYYVSGPTSMTDSPIGNYPDNADEILTTTASVDLSTAISARLGFWARWQLEAGFDYTEVQVSTDNGNTWIPQCGKYTIGGNGNQDPGMPLYNGFQLDWVKEDISLDDYLGKNILIQFELKSDAGTNFDGFYFDDLVVQMISSSNGIQEYKESAGLSVSQNMPNPAQDYTYINYEIKDGRQGVLQIFNPMGQLIRTENLSSSNSHIRVNTQALAAGVYFYRIEEGSNASAPRRMVIAK
jgi:hypothetical protein